MPKPVHLQEKYGRQFQDESIAKAYPNRPPYPNEVFDILVGLINDEPRSVLDVGAGTGDISRFLASRVARIDAVDFSEVMLQKGKNLPGGNQTNLHWILGRVEDSTLHPPYALITAGESLHWLDWEIVLPRFASLLTSNGFLAIVGRSEKSTSWHRELLKLIQEYSTNKDFQPYNLVEELEKRKLFRLVGSQETASVEFTQTIDEYIESIHSRNGFSRNRMAIQAAAEFDLKSRELLSSYYPNGLVHLQIYGRVEWGEPLAIAKMF